MGDLNCKEKLMVIGCKGDLIQKRRGYIYVEKKDEYYKQGI